MHHITGTCCPYCRNVCYVSQVKDVIHGSSKFDNAEGKRDEEEKEDEKVLDTNCTSKIYSIVRTLLKIRRREPTAKALVFSCVNNCSIL